MEMTEEEKLDLKGKQTRELFFAYMKRKTILDTRKAGEVLKGKEGQGTGRNWNRKQDGQKEEWKTGSEV